MSQQEAPVGLIVDPNLKPAVAFFIYHVAKHPDVYLKADPQLGGLTDQGERVYTSLLHKSLEPVLNDWMSHPLIAGLAMQYRQEAMAETSQGTLSFSLEGKSRQAFLNFLTENKFVEPYLLKDISTRMII